MRILLLLLLAPVAGWGQINRSAKELASEHIREYIQTRLFKDMPYKAVSYGEMKTYKQPNTEKAWILEHNFEIIENRFQADKKVALVKPYRFFFYMDKRIKVIGAESVQLIEL